MDQIFIFDVPVLPTESIRGNSIKIKVKGKVTLGRDKLIGETEIQLSSLMSENQLFGWFPLRAPKSSVGSATYDPLQVCGSIKLRVQWIHSEHSLLQYVRCLVKRLVL